jgi:ATP adenylyltransferase/5',5'''-P-1,P-4-tetraphosphate phosphorylase II
MLLNYFIRTHRQMILCLASVVFLAPVAQTDVAKLMAASAGHVGATLCTLDEDVTTWTPLPVLEILLEIGIACSLVLRQVALLAKFDLAIGTL